MKTPAPISRRDFGRLAAAAAGLSFIDPEGTAARSPSPVPEADSTGSGPPTRQEADAPPLESEPLMDIVLDLGQAQVLGPRRIVPVTGGTFEGPRLQGRALEGGADWVRARPDDASELDVRITLETDDEALIYVTYRGILHNPTDGDLYWRVTPYFETAAEQYDWLNRIVTVGVGRQQPGQAAYWFYRIL
ncbi:MAG: DUF3237 domain-containing protein [Gemmatimonadota bacterium]